MRIAYISAGAGSMYCGSCLHDNALAGALQRKGHDVALVPTYTPLRTEDTDHSLDRLFYGAINVYLEQKLGLFRHTPRLVDRLLESPALLSWASRLGDRTDPAKLGALTLSVLEGEHGKQRKELERLVSWLEEDLRPDIVHLTNSMLLGMTRRIKHVLDVPVVSTLQGEDLFVEGLGEPQRSEVRRTLIERARDVDGLIATSCDYAEFMTDYLRAPREKMHHVSIGLNLRGHGEKPPAPDGRPFVIGYLARQCPEKGLHVLVEAFRRLAEQAGAGEVRLKVAGWVGRRDRSFVEGLRRRIRDWGLEDAVEFGGEVDRREKIAFIQSLHVLSVPTVYREPKGMFVLEALANGVPVVQPRHGSFPEMIGATGGGLLFEPDSPDALAVALTELKDNAARRMEMGRRGREQVRRHYSDDAEADATLEVYHTYLAEAAPSKAPGRTSRHA